MLGAVKIIEELRTIAEISTMLARQAVRLCDVAESLQISQRTVQRHMQLLRRLGAVYIFDARDNTWSPSPHVVFNFWASLRAAAGHRKKHGPNNGPLDCPEEIAPLLGTMSDEKLAAKCGHSILLVSRWRRQRGVLPNRASPGKVSSRLMRIVDLCKSGMTPRDIAAHIGCCRNNVYTHIRRAKWLKLL